MQDRAAAVNNRRPEPGALANARHGHFPGRIGTAMDGRRRGG
jgi:hypothetical protein